MCSNGVRLRTTAFRADGSATRSCFGPVARSPDHMDSRVSPRAKGEPMTATIPGMISDAELKLGMRPDASGLKAGMRPDADAGLKFGMRPDASGLKAGMRPDATV